MNNTNNTAPLAVGTTFTCAADFTTPIGCSFRKGHKFTIVSIGSVNCRAAAEICGTLVWVTRGDLRDAGIDCAY